MDLVLDTSALIHIHRPDSPEHASYRAFVEAHMREASNRLLLSPIVVQEWLHVVTDGRRFPEPLSMAEAIALIETYLGHPSVGWLPPGGEATVALLDLLSSHRLGRKRISDTMLAASMKVAGVSDLLTRNTADFEVFDFLVLHDPAAQQPAR